jgi:hypothetical protein
MSRIQLGAVVTAPALLLLLCTASASAAIVASPSALHPASTLIDFSSFPVGTLEPIVSGNVTITTSSPTPFPIRAPLANQLQHPGIFSGHYLGHGPANYLIDFNTPVSQLGLGVHDPNFAGNQLLAYDSAGNLLEGVSSILTGPVGGSFSTFLGFVRPTADIAYVELRNAPGDWLGIDNVMYFAGGGTGAVPEPSSLALLGVIGAGLGLVLWQRRGK